MKDCSLLHQRGGHKGNPNIAKSRKPTPSNNKQQTANKQTKQTQGKNCNVCCSGRLKGRQ